MKVHTCLTIRADAILSERLAVLTEQWPQYASVHGLRILNVADDDPEVRAILAQLHEWGYKRYPDTGGQFVKGVDMWYERFRTYDESDLREAEFLEIVPDDKVKTWSLAEYRGFRSVSGIIRKTLNLDADFAAEDSRPVYCSQGVRESLETQAFRGIRFLDVPLIRKIPFTDDYEPVEWKPASKRFWGLNSEIELPPCSPRLYTVFNGKIFTSREFRTTPREWGFNDVEWRYRRSELEAVGAFDVARVWEHHNPGYDHISATIIVSPRFYRFCREQGFKVGFRPVRIDEE